LKSKVLKAFRRVADALDGYVLNDQVNILEVGLCVLRTEVQSKFLGLARLNLALHWLYSIVSLVIHQTDHVCGLRLVDGPVEGDKDRG
jgi:hypothetical protein